MPRQMLTDEHWSKLKLILLQQGIYDKADLRTTVEGILYRMRTGCPWRDLPEVFGFWNTVYKRFNAWSASGKLMRIFSSLVEDPDVEWLFIDPALFTKTLTGRREEAGWRRRSSGSASPTREAAE
ncbi:hypothetical protein GCM10027172_15540 [Halomonas garicola]